MNSNSDNRDGRATIAWRSGRSSTKGNRGSPGSSSVIIKESDKTTARQALHTMNNSLHVFGLQAELARLHIDNGNLHGARAALDLALQERNKCGETTRQLQRIIQSL